MSFSVILVVLVAGTTLCIIGLLGRWHGSEPRCRKCKYDLTGLTSDNCPECGKTLGQLSIQLGLRRRRHLPLISGCALIIVVAAEAWSDAWSNVSQRLATMNWYEHQPFGWVLEAAAADRSKALTELLARLSNDALTAEQLHALAETALTKHAQNPAPPGSQEWIDLLEYMAFHSGLTAEQLERYFGGMIHLELRARPTVRSGDPIPFVTVVSSRAPTNSALWFQLDVDAENARPLKVDRSGHYNPRIEPKPPRGNLDDGHYYRDPAPVENTAWLGRELRPGTVDSAGLVPGLHVLSREVQVVLYLGAAAAYAGRRGGGKPLWSGMIAHQASFELLPQGISDDTKFVAGDGGSTQIAQALGAYNASLVWVSDRGPDHYQLQIEFNLRKPLPFDLATEVFVRTGPVPHGGLGGEPPASLAFAKGLRGRQWVMIPAPDLHDLDLEIVLRSSQNVARRTIDLHEIWEGELVLQSIRIRSSP